MLDCIFCKIVNKEIGTSLIYEDADCVVFSDLHPKANTHLLVVSKCHIPSIKEITYADSKLLGNLLNVCRISAKKLKLKGYRLQINVGSDGGQEIFHLHIHLLSNSKS